MAYDRNLASINRKLLKGSRVLQDSIQERLARGRPLAMLDIGCGLGMALLELAWMFRDANVRFAGINKDPGEPLASQEDLRATARQIGLAPEDELERFRLPELFFEDATHMHFEDESFDVVYASSVLRFVSNKAEFLEDVARVLKPGGVGFIRVGSKGWDYPHGPSSAGAELTPYPARWVLRHGKELIPLEAYLTLASGNGVGMELINRPSCVIRVTKARSAVLDLGLRYVPSLSLPMRQLGYEDEDGVLAKGGVRSVYDVGEESYRALVEGGVLGSHNLSGPTPDVRVASRPDRNDEADANQAKLQRKRQRLASYLVGQRVNVKGRRHGHSFRAAKIKMVHYQAAEPHLEGLVERVDADQRTLGLVGITVLAGAVPSAEFEALRPGLAVRARGIRAAGAFVVSEISPVETTANVVEEIQGPIEAIDPASGTIQVAGIAVVADARTKIDRMDAR